MAKEYRVFAVVQGDTETAREVLKALPEEAFDHLSPHDEATQTLVIFTMMNDVLMLGLMMVLALVDHPLMLGFGIGEMTKTGDGLEATLEGPMIPSPNWPRGLYH